MDVKQHSAKHPPDPPHPQPHHRKPISSLQTLYVAVEAINRTYPLPQTNNQPPTLCPWQPDRSAEPRSTLVQVTDTPGSDSVPAYPAHVSATASYVTHSQPVPAPLSKRMYLRWSLCTLHLHSCQLRVTVGDSGLCCCTCVTYFERL